MNRVRELIEAEALIKEGYTGRGITAAILDSGVYPHPDFRERIVDFQDFLYGKKGCYDDYGHGTHVAGILAGNGKMSKGIYRGIAPFCRILPIKVLDRRGDGNRKDVIRGIDFILTNRKKYNIRILNISVGAVDEGKEDEELVMAVEAAWDAGLVVVAAAGNMGPREGSITSPGNSRKIITVGSSDDRDVKLRKLRGIQPGYSGRGPTCACVVKPEILAPGSGIVSCNARYPITRRAYTVKSGTSMATPVVAGAAALLLEKKPDLTNLEVKMRMRESTDDLGLPKVQQGWGQINLRRLLSL